VIPARLSPSLGIGLWWLGVIVALRAQYLLTSNPDELYGAWRMAAAALIGLVGTSLIDRGRPLTVPPTPRVERPTAGRGRRLRAGILTIAGLVALAVTIYGVSRAWPVPVQAALWVLALALVAAGASVYGGPPFRLRRSRRETLELVGIVAIMGLAFWLRFFSLRDIPLDVHGDEGAVGIEARSILSGDVTNLFGLGWASMPELAFAASAVSLDVFGNDLFGLRLASVIQGTLSVGLLYGIAKRLFPVRVAVLAAFIFTVSQMAIHYGRIGNNYIQALFASLLLFYFLLRGLTTRRPIDFLLTGFAVGLTASVYIAARLTPAIAVLYVLHRTIAERGFLRAQLRGLLLVVAGTLIFLAPQGVLYAHEPGRVLDRVNGVFLLREGPLQHELDAYHTNSVAVVLEYQFLHSLDAFNVRGESSNQYGQQAPLLDYWSAALFVLGLVLVTMRLRDSRHFLLASWFWLTLVTGSVLTVDAMFSPHIVGMLGVLALLPCLAVDAGWRGMVLRFGTWGKRFATVLVLAFAVLAARANYIDYFQTHLQKMESPNFMAVLSKYVWTINDRYRVYLLAEADTSLRYDTAHFLIPDVDGVDVRDHPLPLPLDRIPEQKGVVFVVRDSKDPRLAAIIAAYPRGVREAHYNVNGFVEFTAIRVERTDLIAAKPNAYVDHAPIQAAELSSLKIP
jgi:4-amino-4-deoxy-L-arabinose transferase-like glycosyltransferase